MNDIFNRLLSPAAGLVLLAAAALPLAAGNMVGLANTSSKPWTLLILPGSTGKLAVMVPEDDPETEPAATEVSTLQNAGDQCPIPANALIVLDIDDGPDCQIRFALMDHAGCDNRVELAAADDELEVVSNPTGTTVFPMHIDEDDNLIIDADAWAHRLDTRASAPAAAL
jgi:hypothetical protein